MAPFTPFQAAEILACGLAWQVLLAVLVGVGLFAQTCVGSAEDVEEEWCE